MTIKYKSAFSLIELMVVIAIVALLSAVAIPAYQNYIIKARATTAFKVASAAIEQNVVQVYQRSGSFPNVTLNDVSANVFLITSDPMAGSGCSAAVTYSYLVGVDTSKTIYPNAGSTVLFFVDYAIDVNGVMQHKCAQVYYDLDLNAGIPNSKILSNCTDIGDLNAGLAAFEASDISVLRAQCL